MFVVDVSRVARGLPCDAAESEPVPDRVVPTDPESRIVAPCEMAVYQPVW